MNLKVGIVGLPNAGKSTLFNALLKKQQALAANYPFATIEPNLGIVPVFDSRLEALAEVVWNEEQVKAPLVPATVEFVDIAGLVKGASVGEGLGNKFLSHIREVNLICHVVRYFEDSDVIHVEGTIDPARDRNIVETELLLADLQTLSKQTEPRGVKEKEAMRRWELIQSLMVALNSGLPARKVIVDEEDEQKIHDLQLLTMKPTLYVANVSESQLSDKEFQANVIKELGDVVFVSAKIESELSELDAEEQKTYLSELGVMESGLERLIQTAYTKLGLISFLTAGGKEIRAWTIRKGTKAPMAAGTIHTDFEKKFIKAEVISFADLVASGTRGKAKEHGKMRLEGKEYEMKDGDVVEFKIGA